MDDHRTIGYLAEGKDALIDSALDGTSREPKVDILAGFEWPRVWNNILCQSTTLMGYVRRRIASTPTF